MHHLGVLRWRASVGNSFTAILKSGEGGGRKRCNGVLIKQAKPVGGAKTVTRTVKIAAGICALRHLCQ